MKRRGFGLWILAGIGALFAFAPLAGCSSDSGAVFEGPADEGDAGQNDGGPDSSDGSDCDGAKAPGDDACVIDDAHGVFVAPSGNDSSGQGTKQAPFQTIAKGLTVAKANGKRVYVCDDGTGYDERITIDSALDGLEVYGGLDCEKWGYGKTKTRLEPSEAGIVWRFDEVAEGFVLQDFEITALDGASPGESSIAMLVNASEKVTLRGLVLTAGKGADGTDGASEEERADDGDNAKNGGNAVCTGSSNGGAGGASSCGAAGGKGGNGATSGAAAQAGADGEPDTLEGGQGGKAASGNATCEDGSAGEDGAAGEAGANPSGLGTLTSAGWKGASGEAGKDGTSGQGGGGGGGATRPSSGLVAGDCNVGSTPVGASGGGGGGGGCGGKGGSGGSPGGASIALVSIESVITLEDSELVAAAGGRGGDGGAGQFPGLGGQGTDGGNGVGGSAAACRGGNGGKGGHGGRGGGGMGGHSLGIAFTGEAPEQTKVEVTTSTAGPGGKGAESEARTDGIAASSQEF